MSVSCAECEEQKTPSPVGRAFRIGLKWAFPVAVKVDEILQLVINNEQMLLEIVHARSGYRGDLTRIYGMLYFRVAERSPFFDCGNTDKFVVSPKFHVCHSDEMS